MGKMKCLLQNMLFALIIAGWNSRAFAQSELTSFSSASVSLGTLVTISGTNLTNPTASTIGGIVAIVISNHKSTLVGMIQANKERIVKRFVKQ